MRVVTFLKTNRVFALLLLLHLGEIHKSFCQTLRARGKQPLLQRGRVESNYVQSIDTRAECPKLRIGVINGVNFHFEVISGLLHLLQPYERHTDIFLSPYVRTRSFDGAYDMVRWSKGTFRRTDMNLSKLPHPHYDMVILVSPDYEVQANAALIKAMNARLTLSIVHNADHEEMDKVLSISNRMELLTLSPHVASALAKSTNRPTNWMLSVYPVPLQPECLSLLPDDQILGSCLKGFAMQGKFSNLRRNYSNIWRQIDSKLQALEDPQVHQIFHMNVLGKGPNRLALPEHLLPLVSVHRRLPCREFYTVIASCIALVPSLANARYFTDKFSSTIMTSLNTGVPIIATSRLMKAYTFMRPEAVFLQQDDEEEIDAMLRVAKLPAQVIMKTRRALAALREELNARSFKMLDTYIKTMCKEIAKSGSKSSRALTAVPETGFSL